MSGGLDSRQAPRRMAVDVTTVRCWEWGTRMPRATLHPAINDFLENGPPGASLHPATSGGSCWRMQQ